MRQLIRVPEDFPKVCKIFWLSTDGSLVSPIMTQSRWRQPLIRARQFETDPERDGHGIFAFRYGHIAAPSEWWTVMAICRIPPGSRAVISPWAVKAEEMTIERLIFEESLRSIEDVHAQVLQLWSPHCEIEYRNRDCDYRADGEPLGFNLRFSPSRVVDTHNGFICLQLGSDLCTDIIADRERGVVIVRSRRLNELPRQGPYMCRRVERAMLRLYEAGNEYVRDILAPWLLYFDQLRQ